MTVHDDDARRAGRSSLVVRVRVHLGMVLRCFAGMMCGVGRVTVRRVSVVSGLLVMTGLMVLRRLSVVVCRALVMLGGRPMVLDPLVSLHDRLSLSDWFDQTSIGKPGYAVVTLPSPVNDTTPAGVVDGWRAVEESVIKQGWAKPQPGQGQIGPSPFPSEACRASRASAAAFGDEC